MTATLVRADDTGAGRINYAHIDPDDPSYGHISVEVEWSGCTDDLRKDTDCQWYGDAELTTRADCPAKPVQLDDTRTLWVSARQQDNATVGIDDHPVNLVKPPAGRLLCLYRVVEPKTKPFTWTLVQAQQFTPGPAPTAWPTPTVTATAAPTATVTVAPQPTPAPTATAMPRKPATPTLTQARTAVSRVLRLIYKSAWTRGTGRKITCLRRAPELRCSVAWRYKGERITEKLRVLRLGGAVRAAFL